MIKKWSFTDCASKVVMKRLQISQAISLDHHFRPFGNVHVMPELAEQSQTLSVVFSISKQEGHVKIAAS